MFVHSQGGFSQPIFQIMPDESIEIIGLPLWSKKQVEILDSTTKPNEIRTVSVYTRVHDSLPWIKEILSNRCVRDIPLPINCNQKLFFSKSCENVIPSGSSKNDEFLNAIQRLFLT